MSTVRAKGKHELSFDIAGTFGEVAIVSVGARIAEARRLKGWSQKALGDAVGQAQTTISSWERNRTEPSRDDVARVADALGVPAVLLEGGEPDVAGGASPQLDLLPIRRRVQAGAWLAVDDLDQTEPRRHPTSGDPRFPHAAQWLSEVVGDSMNALGILEGDLVHIVDLVSSGWLPKTGDIVEVERWRHQGAECEVTIKQAEVTAAGTILLWPRSTNPRWKAPLPMAADDDAEVRVAGLMINLVRRFG